MQFRSLLLTWLVTAFLAVTRFGVEGQDVVFDRTSLVKTFAHFFLGVLLGIAGCNWFGRKQRPDECELAWWWPLVPFVVLTVIEVVAFKISGAKVTVNF